MRTKIVTPAILAAVATAASLAPAASDRVNHCEPPIGAAAVCPAPVPDSKHTEESADHEQTAAAQSSAASGDVTIELRGQASGMRLGKLTPQLAP